MSIQIILKAYWFQEFKTGPLASFAKTSHNREERCDVRMIQICEIMYGIGSA